MFAKTLIKNYLSIKYVYINYIVERIFIKYIAIPEKKNICFTAAFAPVQRNDVVWMHTVVTVKRIRKWKWTQTHMSLLTY